MYDLQVQKKILVPLSKKTFIWLNIVVMLLFGLDRISRWLALYTLPDEGIFIWPGVTGFILEQNQGILFSFNLSKPWLSVLTAIIILLLVKFYVGAYKRKEFVAVAALSLLITGTISNFLDRIQYGHVVDMIVLTTWPIFNLADIMILAGIGWLIGTVLTHKKV
ncbi:signal peptidase II [Patescibacteria group bacterium]|nr:signal peptidase II [Patescibacteria group bacterium]